MKEGKIIKSSQGQYAKVISVKGNRYGISAWVRKEKMAEEETAVNKFLNSFGMSQVLGKEEVGDAAFVPEGKEINATPGAVELAKSEKIELGDVQGTGKDGSITKGDVQALIKARAEVDQMVDYVITEETVDQFPPLPDGTELKVGDTIKLSPGHELLK